MKAIDVWDYVMRRKAQFLAGLAALIVILACFLRIFTHFAAPRTTTETTLPTETYNNSLTLQIGPAEKPVYQLTFRDDYSKAVVHITDDALPAEAYVRLFDAKGNLLRGEYTEMQDVKPAVTPTETPDTETGLALEETEDGVAEKPTATPLPAISYRFEGAPKAYEITIEPGSTLEVNAASAKFLSTLDGAEATAFSPSGAESYIVTATGLRKSTWSETKAAAENYQLLKRYLVRQIEDYKATATETILADATLDLANKKRVIAAFDSLSEADQAPYASFIDLLKNGKANNNPDDGASENPGETPKPDENPSETEKPGEKPEESQKPVETPPVATDKPSLEDASQTLGGGVNTEAPTQNPQTQQKPQGGQIAQATKPAKTPAVTQPSATPPTESAAPVDETPKNGDDLLPSVNGELEITENGEKPVTTEKSTEEKTTTSAKATPFWQKMTLLIVIIVALSGLIRFIFDHYIR